jgi:dihydrofolate reductase
MGRLKISTAMTIDGVIEVADWFIAEGEHMEASFATLEGVDALLMGRKVYEGLAAYWPTQEGEWADLLNAMPKYVASRTLQEPLEWNSTLIEGDVAEGVSRLKEELDGELFLTGCGELARHLLDAGLIDELIFGIHPAVAGSGARPFFESGAKTKLRLIESKAYDTGVTILRYEPAAD